MSTQEPSSKQIFLYAVAFFFISSLIRADNDFIIKENQSDVAFALVNNNTDAGYLDGIRVGCGYCSDIQRISTGQCYNAEIADNGCKKIVNGGGVLSFDQLLDTLKIKNSLKTQGFPNAQQVGFWFFFRGGEPSYLKSIEDSENSLSLNFVYFIKNKINIRIKGYGEYALNEKGRVAYKNGNNPEFGLICGDHYFSSFTEGAMLLMALDIRFDSHSEKEKFKEYSGSSSFFKSSSSSKDIEKIMLNIKGHINLKAYQLGGSPELLTNILKKDINGNFYLMACDVNYIQDCVDAARGLLNYAVNEFPNQVSCDPPKGLYPLGIEYEYKPISMLGLKISNSLVTYDILQAQGEFANQLHEYSQYMTKISEAINNYPVSWDKDSDFYKNMQCLAEKVKNNFELLQSEAEKCFDRPEKCRDIKDDTQLEMMIITPEDLKDIPTKKEYAIYCCLSCFLNERGIAEYRLGNYKKAIDYYTKALKLNDNWISENRSAVLNNRGDSYCGLKLLFKAKEDYNNALIQPNDKWLVGNFSLVKAKLDKLL